MAKRRTAFPMSEPRRVLLAGATGLVGTRVMEAAVGQDWLRLIALTRREAPMPRGVRVEMLVAHPSDWPEAVAAITRRSHLRAGHDVEEGRQRRGFSGCRSRSRPLCGESGARSGGGELRARLFGRRRCLREVVLPQGERRDRSGRN